MDSIGNVLRMYECGSAMPSRGVSVPYLDPALEVLVLFSLEEPGIPERLIEEWHDKRLILRTVAHSRVDRSIFMARDGRQFRFRPRKGRKLTKYHAWQLSSEGVSLYKRSKDAKESDELLGELFELLTDEAQAEPEEPEEPADDAAASAS